MGEQFFGFWVCKLDSKSSLSHKKIVLLESNEIKDQALCYTFSQVRFYGPKTMCLQAMIIEVISQP